MRARVRLLPAVLFLLLATIFAGCTADEAAPPPVVETPPPPPPPDPRTFLVGLNDCYYQRQLISVEGPNYEDMLPEGFSISYNAQEPTGRLTFLEALISVCGNVTQDGNPLGNGSGDAPSGEILVVIPVTPPSAYQLENTSRDFFAVTTFVANNPALLERYQAWGASNVQEATITVGPYSDEGTTPAGAGVFSWTAGGAEHRIASGYENGMLPAGSPITYAGGHWRVWVGNSENVTGQLWFELSKTRNRGFGYAAFTSTGTDLFPERAVGGWTRAFDVDGVRRWFVPEAGWPGLHYESAPPAAGNETLAAPWL